MREYEFDSLEEYLKIVSSIVVDFGCHASDLWFRGVRSDKFKLQPGAVWRGLDEARETSIIAEFMTYFGNYSNVRPKTSFELYGLMQHYGLPTRLLDWSLSPLIALYFALEGDNAKREVRTVWALFPMPLNRISANLPMVLAPNEFKSSSLDDYLPKYLRSNSNPIPQTPVAVVLPFTNQRITSQKGAFTLHGFSPDSVDEYCTRFGLDNMVKIKLKKEGSRHDILNKLFSIGVKEDDVYQDLNSLSKRIVREFNC